VKRPHHNYRDVPPCDVTRNDVIANDVIAEVERDTATAEWRLSELWIDESDVSCQVEPFTDRRHPHLHPHAAAADNDDDDNDDDDDDDDDCAQPHRRRSRPDIVPRQPSLVTSPVTRRDQELNKTCDDVTVLRRLRSPGRCHCMPVDQSYVITPSS